MENIEYYEKHKGNLDFKYYAIDDATNGYT